MLRQRIAEALLQTRNSDTIMWTRGTGQRGFDRRKIDIDNLRVNDIGTVKRFGVDTLGAQEGLDPLDRSLIRAGKLKLGKRLIIRWEKR